VSVVARDAMDGGDVWKTVAFLLLDSLVQVSSPKVALLSVLSQSGYLSGFVTTLKDSDGQLQGVLRPDPDDMNVLYIYEAKMSLFVRMTQSKQGAERLLESRMIKVLAGCDFVDARPEMNQAFFDQNNFLPAAIQRYHQLLMPVLQIVCGIMVTLGSRHATATSQALDFLRSHRDTVILMLKTDISQMSPPALEEIRLIVVLSSHVVEAAPRTELVSTSGFGGLHAAILNLATRALGSKKWMEDVERLAETEAQILGLDEQQYRAEVSLTATRLEELLVSYKSINEDISYS